MATRTPTRRKPPTRRTKQVSLGGGLSLSWKSKAKRAVKQTTTGSNEWRAAKFVGTRVWRGGRWLVVRSATAGWNTTSTIARSTGGHVAEWGRDKARYGLATPLMRLTTVDDDGEVTAQRIPVAQFKHRVAVLLGETREPEFRLSGDRVRADEPHSPVWADSTRMDREVVPMATRRRGKEAAMAKELSKLEELFGFEPEAPEQIPEEIRDWIDAADGISEGFSELAEAMKGWNVNETAVGKVEQIAENMSTVVDLLKEVVEGVEEQLEHQITTKKAG